ncbi:hypothetical protein EDM68_04320 [Candidatus Uhrbacteria bacterium]|nr:MAG: hypothetical protein EDM68_04320 [Candidatus Uhrbacteria bacterium]
MREERKSLPALTDLFRDPHPVIGAFLAGLDSSYGYWYPVDERGEADEERTMEMFADRQRELGDDELTGLMPLIRYQPVRGVEAHMLFTAFDETVHPLFDMKDEQDFRHRRRAMGPTHPSLRSFGSSAIYGGLESKFDHRSVIQGPLFVGRRCTVRASAKIIGPSLLGDGALLNTSSVFTRSVMGDGSQVDDLAVIKDSLLGRSVYVMTGAKLLHRAGLNGETITVSDERVSGYGEQALARRKMGCVVGDGCVIGANAVLGAGTILLPGCRVPHGLVVPSGIYDQTAIDRLARGI